ncbi:MAG: glutamine amidotransferase [Cyanobacteria bacterium P01_A01_bin.105]
MTHALTITHLYPKNLNLYGDLGNVIALQRRCEWYGIEVTIEGLHIGDPATPGQTDLYFMGGGQDNDQVAVVDDFHTLKRDAILADTENSVPFLGVCGGYQLMGNTFLMGDNRETRGLGIIDVTTKAPGIEVNQRCIGNLVAELTDDIQQQLGQLYEGPKTLPSTLVGFENHSGQTYLGPAVEPLAKTLAGFGNNYEARYEGARYKNVFGSYLHGSMLPKNPHFADYLIWLALGRKYNTPDVRLSVLPDIEEMATHQSLVARFTAA